MTVVALAALLAANNWVQFQTYEIPQGGPVILCMVGDIATAPTVTDDQVSLSYRAGYLKHSGNRWTAIGGKKHPLRITPGSTNGVIEVSEIGETRLALVSRDDATTFVTVLFAESDDDRVDEVPPRFKLRRYRLHVIARRATA